MAKARYTTEVMPDIPGVTLDLTGEEAIAVLSLLGKVAGGYSAPQAAASRVHAALLGIKELRQAPRWITDRGIIIFTGENQ